MLSILIPVYNYNIKPLVQILQQQADDLSIVYEIIVCDDASSNTFDNESIKNTSNIHYIFNSQNLHISRTRNKLLRLANFPWVLLLDADTIPIHGNFLSNYWLNKNVKSLLSGGFTYPNTLHNNSSTLRLKYGIKIEKHQHKYSCCNLFFNKNTINQRFDEGIISYGFEDTLFFLELQKSNIPIEYIDNKVQHNITESNEAFLEKTTNSCLVLAQLIQQNKLIYNDTSLSKTYRQLHKLNCLFILDILQKTIHSTLIKNLKSTSPSLLFFSIYKLLAFHQAMKFDQKIESIDSK